MKNISSKRCSTQLKQAHEITNKRRRANKKKHTDNTKQNKKLSRRVDWENLSVYHVNDAQ